MLQEERYFNEIMNHSDIVNKIPERFDSALKAGDLLFFPSTTTKHIESNIEVKYLIKVSAIISDHVGIRSMKSGYVRHFSVNPQFQPQRTQV